MKITKAQGRACLRDAERISEVLDPQSILEGIYEH